MNALFGDPSLQAETLNKLYFGKCAGDCLQLLSKTVVCFSPPLNYVAVAVAVEVACTRQPVLSVF